MKHLLFFFCWSLFCPSISEPFPKTARNFSVTLDKVVLLANNHVGNDWDTYLKINGEIVAEGEHFSVQLKGRAPLRIEVHATEMDAYHPDTAMEELVIAYSDAISIEKDRFYQEVTVTEIGGKYEGNQARLKFTILIEQQ